MVVDIYDQTQLDIYDQMVQIAHAANKPVSIEETWRPAFTGPLPPGALRTGRGIEYHTIKGVGSADFEDLDAKWMKAMVLYASTRGMEAVTPYYSETFFAYVTSGPDRPFDSEYNHKVLEAVSYTHLDVYKRQVVVFGQPVTAVAQSLGMLREFNCVAKGLRGVAAFQNRRKIQDGQRKAFIRTRLDDQFPALPIGLSLIHI